MPFLESASLKKRKKKAINPQVFFDVKTSFKNYLKILLKII